MLCHILWRCDRRNKLPRRRWSAAQDSPRTTWITNSHSDCSFQLTLFRSINKSKNTFLESKKYYKYYSTMYCWSYAGVQHLMDSHSLLPVLPEEIKPLMCCTPIWEKLPELLSYYHLACNQLPAQKPPRSTLIRHFITSLWNRKHQHWKTENHSFLQSSGFLLCQTC